MDEHVLRGVYAPATLRRCAPALTFASAHVDAEIRV